MLTIRIASLYRSQTSSVDLCKQNNLLRNRLTSLYWSQTLRVDLCKQNNLLRNRLTSLYWSQTLRVDLCKQNSVFSTRITSQCGSSSHLWFLHAKRRLQDQNCMSLWVPDLTCDFVHAISVSSIRITRLYRSQTSSVVLACKTETFGPELQFSMGPSPQLSFGVCKTV